MIRHFNREKLLDWLEANPPTGMPRIARAMQDGRVELLGVFSPIPPFAHSGWVVKVVSRYGVVWHVVISLDEANKKYFSFLIDNIPWDNYCGEQSSNPLYQGDKPEKYKGFKDGKNQDFRIHQGY